MPDQTTSYYHTDQISSARLMTSVDGYAIWAATYLPFGYEYNAQPGVNRYKFATYQRDAESGLDYAKFRYYSSTIGRFLSPDPAGMAAVDLTNPQSWNRYGYVGNDPLNATDAAGLNPRNLDSGSLDLHFGSGNWFGNCTENGAQSQCGGMFGLLGFDALQACPGNDCSPKNYNGQWYFFEAHADGSFGYFAFGQSSEVTPANDKTTPPPCQTQILNAANNQFGTNYTDANVSSPPFNYSTGAPEGQGTLNLNIYGSTAGVSPGYYPVHWWTYAIGYGPTLHVVSGPGGHGGLDSQLTLPFGPDQATFHIDAAFPYNPIGTFFHWLLNMTKAGGYPQC